MPAYQPTDRNKTDEIRNAALFEFAEIYTDEERAYTMQAAKPLMAYCNGLGEAGVIELLFVLCQLINESEDGINEENMG